MLTYEADSKADCEATSHVCCGEKGVANYHVSERALFETDLCTLVDMRYINLIKSYPANLLTNLPRIIIIFIVEGGELPHLISDSYKS
jgi:hypothetical protein